MSDQKLLDEWFDKIDRDIAFLSDCFAEVLEELGEHELARALPWSSRHERDSSDADGRVDRELQALSIGYHLLNLVEENSAAQARRQRENLFGNLHEPGLWGHGLRRLQENGYSQSDIARLLSSFNVEIVLTAHPTEAKRPPVLRQHRALFDEFSRLENAQHTGSERELIRDRIKVILERLWRTGEMYLERPNVLSELDHIMDYFVMVLPAAASSVRLRLARAWREAGFAPESLPDAAPGPALRFGNWVGGDRDGHPLVTAEVTRETLARARSCAIRSVRARLQSLLDNLTLSDLFQAPPPDLLRAIEWERVRMRAEDSLYPHEPWRRYASLLLRGLDGSERGETGSYVYPAELETDLHRLRDSLVAVGAQRLAEAEVDPILLHLECFGFHMAALDIRQNSAFHAKAAAQMLHAAGLDDWDYESWPAEKRVAFLNAELRSLRPLVPRHGELGKEAHSVLDCFRAVADHIETFGPAGIGKFIVSMTRDVSDLLVVYLFAREVGLLRIVDDTLRCEISIVPLFETMADLENAAEVMRQFLANPIARDSALQTEGQPPAQEVMVGYSDSNKDVGIFASHWVLNRAQYALAKAGAEHGTSITFFHGRGGTFSRGAGPIHRFLGSLPKGSLQGAIRMTEQGEVIAQKYGNLPTAEFNLELLLAGVTVTALEHRADESEEPRYLAICTRLSEWSAEAYRDLIRSKEFLEFWSQATPIDALEQSFIGSRPSRRTGRRNIEDLRAIPWVFSWTQARYYLTGWFGVGAALSRLQEKDPAGYERLQVHRDASPFVHYVLYNAETSHASADVEQMRQYANLVTNESIRESQFRRIVDEYERTEYMLNHFFGASREIRRPRLVKTLAMRAEGLRRLHARQIQLLRDWRALLKSGKTADADTLFPTLLLSINAIASAERTTG